MMRENTLLRTNIIVCAIITVGFIVTSIIGYQSNTNIFEKDAEHVSTLAAEGIYYQIDKILSEPINVSLTMANDSLLKDFLADENQNLFNESYTQQLRDYLYAYREKYAYDSVFLVSVPSSRYYHFNGLDRVLTSGNEENIWYYDFLNSGEEYSLNVDNDEAADNSITAFVNCKIKGRDDETIGIIGVGLKVDSLQTLLKEYDKKFDVTACLVDDQGVVQLSSERTGFEHINLFKDGGLVEFKDAILSKQTDQQASWCTSASEKSYVVTQYIPNLKWHLVVEYNMTAMNQQLNAQLYKGIGIIALIILFVLVTITNVLRRYKAQIIKLSISQKLEYQKLLNELTEELYDNIFEINITHNRAAGESMQQYFEELGMSRDVPYDDALRRIARQEIKEEYAQGYLDTFMPEPVMRAYSSGISVLSYDFMIAREDGNYHWIRISARIFYWPSDESVRMISYRKNIDMEKKRELYLLEKSRTDLMTGLYNKGVVEETISDILAADVESGKKHAMLIIDIDNFKNVNDRYGHAFGDCVITEFAAELKFQFRDSDIIGRVGGDEFAVLMIECGSISMLSKKLERFCLRTMQKDFGQQKDAPISCSIGAVIYPDHGITYSELYEKADQALYYAKAHGKNSYHILDTSACGQRESYVDLRDFKVLLDNATDGVAKFACTSPWKMLYFNAELLNLMGVDGETLSMPDFDFTMSIHPDDRARVLEDLRIALHENLNILTQFRMRHADGHDIPVKLYGLFVNEIYQNCYPVFYAVYTDLSSNLETEKG